MPQIERERFLARLETLASLGRLPPAEGGGRDRRPFSPAERQARRFLEELAHQAGLTVSVDRAANLSVRLPNGDGPVPTLLMGSHLDTVPHGGAYDGALGVMAGLEVLCSVQDAALALPWNLEVIAFTDEEGRFGDFFGSRAVAGQHTDDTIAAFLTRAGTYPDDLNFMRDRVPGGLQPAAIAGARRPATDLAGYLELHIEQGPRLEHAGIPVGVVTAIFGRTSYRLRFQGRADHAGTTPLNLRADALVAAAGFIAQAPERVRRDFPSSVVTCGQVNVQPGVYNVVPHSAEVLVEYRAAEAETLSGIQKLLYALAEEVTRQPGLGFTLERTSHHSPVPMHGHMQAAIRSACDRLGYAHMDLPSGAGHDALMMAQITPAGMIFVPSKGGRSHCPEEDTAPDNLVAGANALLQSVLVLAGIS